MNDIKIMLESHKVQMISLNASMPDKSTLKLSMIIRKPSDLGMDRVINLVNGLDEAKSMEIE